jgi:hypothetical protein
VYVFEYLNAKNDSEKLKIIKESVKNVRRIDYSTSIVAPPFPLLLAQHTFIEKLLAPAVPKVGLSSPASVNR